jgi:hypothetical protein
MRLLLVLALFACRDQKREREPEPRPIVEEEPDPAPPPKSAFECNPEDGKVCVGDDVLECTPDGKRGKRIMACKAGCKRGTCNDTCAAKGVELVYIVSDANELVTFDPSKLPDDPFALVGRLACDAPPGDTPFSMAIDNRGVAWVLYDDGKLYRVSILDAFCARTGNAPRGAPKLFGMGFAGDRKGETLFVADDDDTGTGNLATVDTAGDEPVYAAIAQIVAGKHKENPELTGTADGKLWGYFPDEPRGFVTELDKKTARAIGRKYTLPDIGTVNAFAFAHWGGTFYIFAAKEENGKSSVHAVDRKTGKYRLVLETTPYEIVGAGVSTCAPLLERL